MKKILGLDLGVGSIGWALVIDSEHEEERNILDTGVRLVPLNPDEKKSYTEGKSVGTNVSRRMARQARRNLQRYRLRRHLLKKVLNELGIVIPAELFASGQTMWLYGLRERALSERINLEELARIWYHLNQKRGYKSSRKGDASAEDLEAMDDKEEEVMDKKTKGILDGIAKREKERKQQGWTVGQWILSRLKEDEHFVTKNHIFNRASYMEEFTRIWEAQAKYHEVLTPELLQRVRDEIIYFQRPLKSQKKLVSKCRFEPSLRCSPKSSPLAEWCAALEVANNVMFEGIYSSTENGTAVTRKEHVRPSREQRDKILKLLYNKGTATAKELMGVMGFTGKHNFHLNYKEGLKGFFATSIRIRKACELIGRDELAKFDLTEEGDLYQQAGYVLWHLLYSAEDDGKLKLKLMSRYGLNDEQAEILRKVRITPDFAGKSAKAMRLIIPHMIEGQQYDAAVKSVYEQDPKTHAQYKRHGDGLTKEENLERELRDKLPLLRKNSMRNPVVEKILNQMINVVNAIIDKHGPVDEIRVELARELKKDAKGRENDVKRNNEQDANHKRIVKRLQEHGFQRVSKRMIEKFKLWEEFGEVSPYEPNVQIKISELLQEGVYDIEHILPKAMYFDDSFGNKTIARRMLNSQKGDTTAMDFMRSYEGGKHMNDYMALLEKNLHNKGTKYRYLTMGYDDLKKMIDEGGGFLNKQLAQTRYISSKAVEILSEVSRNVWVTIGAITDYLRSEWELDKAMQEANKDLYAAQGRLVQTVYIDKQGQEHPDFKITGWSKRDDNRHHAIDAIIVAFTRQSIVQNLNTLNQRYEQAGELKEKRVSHRRIPAPMKHFRQVVLAQLNGMLLSLKIKNKVASLRRNKITNEIQATPRGAFHKETVYAMRKTYEKVVLNSKFDVGRLDDLVHDWQKKLVLDRLAAHGNDVKRAFKDLDKDPIWVNGPRSKQLREVTIWKYEYTEKVALGKNPMGKPSVTLKDLEAGKLNDRLLTEELTKSIQKDAKYVEMYGNEGRTIQYGPYKVKRVTLNAQTKSALRIPRGTYKDAEGNTKEAFGYVVNDNNHHSVVYELANGKRVEKIVNFWEAFENYKQTQSPFGSELPEAGARILFTIQKGDFMVFNMTEEELRDAIRTGNKTLICRNLYYCQKFSAGDYLFRRHFFANSTEAEKDEEGNTLQTVGHFARIRSVSGFGIKVRIDLLGQIHLV